MNSESERPETELVTLADAAEQLDVHYMTAYRYVRTGRMVAEKRAGKWWVTADDLAAVVAEGTGARRRAVDSGTAPRALMVEPFMTRLVAGDTAGCWDMISDALAAGATPVEVHTRLVRAALVEVGESWSNGDLTVADEHRATSSAYRLLGQMGPLFRHRGRRRGTIVVGAVSGDPHALPSAMMADLLSDRRFDVIDLGANTPTESFVTSASQCDDLVGIGMCVILSELASTARDQVRGIRAQLPTTFVLVGGRAITADNRTDFDGLVDAVSSTADQVCEAFESAIVARER